MYVSSRKPQYHRGSSIDFLNLRGHLALFGKKKVLLNEAMVSNKSNVCKCQQVSKEKYARMNPKAIKCSVSEYKWGHIRMFTILCFLVVKNPHREYKQKRPTEDFWFILIISYEKKW